MEVFVVREWWAAAFYATKVLAYIHRQCCRGGHGRKMSAYSEYYQVFVKRVKWTLFNAASVTSGMGSSTLASTETPKTTAAADRAVYTSTDNLTSASWGCEYRVQLDTRAFRFAKWLVSNFPHWLADSFKVQDAPEVDNELGRRIKIDSESESSPNW
jgi:hypothetical protein